MSKKDGNVGIGTTTPLYDDNYGFYSDDDDPIERAKFYEMVQKDSVEKICDMCERTVTPRRSYKTCNSCMEKLEKGMQW